AAELGDAALACPADVSQAVEVEEAVRRTHERFGRLDVVVTSAGIGHWTNIENLGEGDWDETMAVNLKGTYLVARAVLPHLRESKGYLLTLSSVSGTIGQAGGTAYNASKWGVRGFTQSFLQEV